MADKDYETRLANLGRNEPCSCSSGKKYKKCHLAADEESHRRASAQAGSTKEESAKSETQSTEKEEQNSNAEIKSHNKKSVNPAMKQSRRAPVARPINTPRKAS